VSGGVVARGSQRVASSLRRWSLSVGFAIILAALLVTAGAIGGSVTAEPWFWSYAIEPFSLFLLPFLVIVSTLGMLPPMSLYVTIVCSAIFYTAIFATLLDRWFASRPRRACDERSR
jgi:hypothetical protein